jgi:circadian clock protein KaiB
MKYAFILYVMGSNPLSQRAIENITRLCEEELKGRYDLEIIDLKKNIHLAEEEKIFATPTLVKKRPAPVQRIMGDLSDREKVLSHLTITQKLEG